MSPRIVGFAPAAWLVAFVAWVLDPAKRKAFYGLLAALGTLLVVAGVRTDSWVTGWVGVVAAALDLVALVLGTWKARRIEVKVLYAAQLALLAALKLVGVLTDGQASYLGDLGNQALAIVPMLILFWRTDTKTPTGEPLLEYRARHGLRAAPEV
ncbi:hypothetical protein G7075_20000 [Phycicoccus sp. HDW14]|uniref:hypothetical protein n=1 Tax=Phycicoccus sp. HDW14 TaxID=2714941 RepID=UPI00140959B3|nr:hypothetical protein [Phycicoccus sp. HDW14]QIM20530.1 hypothetical protein G7075_04250 [Phycicoccus sp. HDW14]QIM22878.1 hypothetical protein G7075_20000 [Phycicoccus sp. HDW14]